MVLGIFTEMTQYIVPMFFLVLGLGVAFMQAFVPTVLTMVYIMLATQHGDDHHHEETGHH
jgi:F0F1-type ATP synthase membrane subunit a